MKIRRLVLLTVLATLGTSAQIYAQAPDGFLTWLEPPPFLEGTDLFWTIQGKVGRQGDQRKLPHRLEADIFPHFIVAFGSRCRNVPVTSEPPRPPGFERPTTTSGLKPCISVTPAVRLRMLREDSAPVPAPSFMPRVNFQWLLSQDNVLSNFYVQAGHHSNGQGGCLFVWTGVEQQNAGDCVEHGTDIRGQESKTSDQFVRDYFLRRKGEKPPEQPELARGYVQANKLTGNFSVNYIKFGFDRATHRNPTIITGVSSWRWGVSAEIRPQKWMFGPLRSFYPSLRVGAVAGLSIANFFGVCNRFDEFVDIGLHKAPSTLADSLSIAVQGTCVWSEEQGLGLFVRYYSGQDYYNASFLETISRIHIGVTINRLKAFGSG